MPFDRPTLTQLRDGALQSIAAARIYDAGTGQVVNPVLLQFDPLTIMAKVMAGLAYEQYGYLDWISLQATPFTATDEAALGWGAMVGIGLKGATTAAGTAIITGQPGSDVAAGTQLARSDGVLYQTTADVVMPAAMRVAAPFEAALPGAAGTIAAGAALALVSASAGLDAAAVVGAAIRPGSDIESIDALRARTLARFASPPNGGAAADYKGWALAVPGVTRAWVTGSGLGPGTVLLHVMFDGSEPAGGFPAGADGISAHDNGGRPRDIRIAAGDQADVADALVPVQPVTSLVYVAGPRPAPIAFEISNLGASNTLANQQAIAAALAAMFVREGDPRSRPVYPSAWTTAIAAVLGAVPFTVNAPTVPILLPFGSLPVAGTVRFNT